MQAHLYNEMVRCYNRSRRKLHRLAIEGKNLHRQQLLQKRIARLFKKLSGLQQLLKLGMATAAISVGMVLFQPNAAQAQISFGPEQINPFGLGIDSDAAVLVARPALADLDNDGDPDMIFGALSENYDSGLLGASINLGTPSAPAMTEGYLFSYAQSILASPTFVDLDNDGDFDMMVGEYYGELSYYENTGTPAGPVYDFDNPLTNPFGLFDSGFIISPAFADLDQDGDMDLMIANVGSYIYYENTGTVSAPFFGSAFLNPFGLSTQSNYCSVSFADLDQDGDLDLMSGAFEGDFFYYENTGTALAPAFALPQINPFGLSRSYQNTVSTTCFVDMDNDGDMDLMSGTADFAFGFRSFRYYENTTPPCSPATYYADGDGDGYGAGAGTVLCAPQVGYSESQDDCNDADASVNPGASDVCNGVDDNCNTVVDENAVTASITPANPAPACKGIEIVLSANTGPDLTYQWFKGSTLLVGETNDTYTIGPNNAKEYKVLVSGNYGCGATSNTVVITRLATPVSNIIIVKPLGNPDLCVNGTVKLRGNGGAALGYQWQVDGGDISGATDRDYIASSTGSYTVVVTNLSTGCASTIPSPPVAVINSCKGVGAVAIQSAEMEMYPNPTDGHFVLHLQLNNQFDGDAVMQVYNALGQSVLSEKIPVSNGEMTKELQFNNEAEGMFFVKVIAGDHVYTGQIVYQH